MDIENLANLAIELKSDKHKNVFKIFENYAKDNSLQEDELEEKLSKDHDCFKCDSCEKFYSYEEYSFFDEECTYCFDSESDDDEEYEEEAEEEY